MLFLSESCDLSLALHDLCIMVGFFPHTSPTMLYTDSGGLICPFYMDYINIIIVVYRQLPCVVMYTIHILASYQASGIFPNLTMSIL